MARPHRLLLVLFLVVAGVSSAGEARAQGDDARYALAGGCYALKSVAAGRVVSKAADGSYTASGGGEPFRMQATALGRYLFYGAKGDFMSAGESGPLPGAPELPVPVPNVPVAVGAADDPVKSVAARARRPTGASTARTAPSRSRSPTAGACSRSTAPGA